MDVILCHFILGINGDGQRLNRAQVKVGDLLGVPSRGLYAVEIDAIGEVGDGGDGDRENESVERDDGDQLDDDAGHKRAADVRERRPPQRLLPGNGSAAAQRFDHAVQPGVAGEMRCRNQRQREAETEHIA